MLMVFFLIAEPLMHKILILFFFLQSWAALSIYYSIGGHAAKTLFASTVHLPGTIICVIFFICVLWTWRLPIQAKAGS